jgi:hypothetical protein
VGFVNDEDAVLVEGLETFFPDLEGGFSRCAHAHSFGHAQDKSAHPTGPGAVTKTDLPWLFSWHQRRPPHVLQRRASPMIMVMEWFFSAKESPPKMSRVKRLWTNLLAGMRLARLTPLRNLRMASTISCQLPS